MKQNLILIGAILASDAAAFPAHADPAAAVRKTLQSLYDQSSAALGHKDIAGATAIDTADYVIVDDKGKTHTLAESQARAKQLFSRPQIIKSTARIDRLAVHDKSAVADVTQHLYMKYTNAKSQHVFITDQIATNRDTWVRQGSTWRRARGQSLTMRVMLNGQLVYKSTARQGK